MFQNFWNDLEPNPTLLGGLSISHCKKCPYRHSASGFSPALHFTDYSQITFHVPHHPWMALSYHQTSASMNCRQLDSVHWLSYVAVHVKDTHSFYHGTWHKCVKVYPILRGRNSVFLLRISFRQNDGCSFNCFSGNICDPVQNTSYGVDPVIFCKIMLSLCNRNAPYMVFRIGYFTLVWLKVIVASRSYSNLKTE